MGEDPGHTFGSLTRDAGRLAAMPPALARRGIHVGRLLAVGGYGLVFEARSDALGDAVVKVPWAAPRPDGEHPDLVHDGHGPNRAHLVSPTGPFVLAAPSSLEGAAILLRETARRQQEGGGAPPLPRIHALVEAGDLPALLMERVRGDDLAWALARRRDRARGALPHLAVAVSDLHASFGPHGDLKPEHVVLTAGGVRLLDPLGATPWLGSIGYSLPSPSLRACFEPPRLREAACVRDLGALAEIACRMWDRSLGWNGRVAYVILNQGNGRFGRGLDEEALFRRVADAASGLPPGLGAWVGQVGDAVLRACLHDVWPPEGEAEGLLDLLPPLARGAGTS